MSVSIDNTVGLHVRALDLHGQRSEILAANLANEDTPGFLARDLDFAAEMQRRESGSLASASPLYRIPGQPAQDGNTVELSVEQAAFSRSATDFQTSLTFIEMKFRGLKQAIEGR